MENKEEIIELLKDGLQTDGGHHKQWYLNEVLKLIDPQIAKEVEEWTGDAGMAECAIVKTHHAVGIMNYEHRP